MVKMKAFFKKQQTKEAFLGFYWCIFVNYHQMLTNHTNAMKVNCLYE